MFFLILTQLKKIMALFFSRIYNFYICYSDKWENEFKKKEEVNTHKEEIALLNKFAD